MTSLSAAWKGVSAFERILLIVGLGVTAVGVYLIRQAYYSSLGDSWLMLLAIFSWLTVLSLFIVSSLSVDLKQEITTLIRQNTEEVKTLNRNLQKLLYKK